MMPDFEIVILGRYQTDERSQEVLDAVPHSDKFKIVNIVD